MKVVVYAICKNEAKFVKRWYESMKEADEIYVLDTGSTDETICMLKDLGVNVHEKIISPWRFDVARNESLKLLPKDSDVCVCTDLDEVFNPGWRKELEKIWNKDTTRCRYIYNWSIDRYDKPIISFYYEKIHSLNNFKWKYPVHEVLEYNGIENYIVTNKIILNHYPDRKKSRKSYLSLLELSIKENPDNDRNLHYLGREYMYNKKWNKSIDTLIRHLNLNTSMWKDERSASMRFISRCYINLKRPLEAKMWLNKAILEAPYLRDAYIELAFLEYQEFNWKEIKKVCNKALKIKTRAFTYINEPFSWDSTIYDLLSLSYLYTNNYKKALLYINKAIKMDKYNKRLKRNKKIILKRLANS